MSAEATKRRSDGATKARRGMSIIETLIAVTISAILLAAVGAAFCASSSVITENDEFFRATQAARVAMTQMLTEIRRSHAVNVSADRTRCDVLTVDNRDRSYLYTSNSLKLVTNDDTSDPDYTLAANVTACTFDADVFKDPGGIDHVVRVAITMNVHVGGNTIRLTGSAAPRREQKYK